MVNSKKNDAHYLEDVTFGLHDCSVHINNVNKALLKRGHTKKKSERIEKEDAESPKKKWRGKSNLSLQAIQHVVAHHGFPCAGLATDIQAPALAITQTPRNEVFDSGNLCVPRYWYFMLLCCRWRRA